MKETLLLEYGIQKSIWNIEKGKYESWFQETGFPEKHFPEKLPYWETDSAETMNYSVGN